ncbi:MAG: HAMP domain-containing sensor histidine kinase, partial [Acidobacteriota bacterium]
TNALQASADGRVDIRIASTEATHVQITVSDTGTGMDADTLARAGDPFFSRRESPVGTGLGLFVARAIAEQLGGALTLDSVEQRGTSVHLTLPRAVVGASPR